MQGEVDLPPPGTQRLRDIAEASEALQQEMEALRMAERRVFKESGLEEDNLLTWNAIDQIRELNKSDPEKWSAEKLTACFPASLQRIRHILAGTPQSKVPLSRIKHHDMKVRERWEALELGDPENLVSPTTKRMLAQGLVKYLPMLAITDLDVSSEDHRYDVSGPYAGKGPGPYERFFKEKLSAGSTQLVTVDEKRKKSHPSRFVKPLGKR